MRQSAFTPAERMTGRYNIEPPVMDDLKQVGKLWYIQSLHTHYSNSVVSD